jgi:ABC-type dipeptide/oligopeptide/nickel transport system permease component
VPQTDWQVPAAGRPTPVLFYVLLSMLVDILYAYLDPRIRLS